MAALQVKEEARVAKAERRRAADREAKRASWLESQEALAAAAAARALRPTTAQLEERREKRSLSLCDARLLASKLERKFPERRRERRHTDGCIVFPAVDPPGSTPVVKTSVEFVKEERERHEAWSEARARLLAGSDDRVKVLMRSDDLRRRAVAHVDPGKTRAALNVALDAIEDAPTDEAAAEAGGEDTAGAVAALPPLAAAKDRARRAARIEGAMRKIAEFGKARPPRPAPLAATRADRLAEDVDVLRDYLQSPKPAARCR